MKAILSPFVRLCRISLAVATAGTLALAGCATKPAAKTTGCMTLDYSKFGAMPDGAPVMIYTLSNPQGMVAKLTEYGAILTELWVPDAKGHATNVVLGFDNLDQYVKGHPFVGAVAGRSA